MPDKERRTRIYLPFADWPEADRMAWEGLFAAGDIFEDAGLARHWRPATRQTNSRRYSRWLGHLARLDALDPEIAPAARVTPERVLVYATELTETVSPRTAASAVIGLKVVMKAMAPETDWRWLMDISNRLNTWAKPSVDAPRPCARSTRFIAPHGRNSTGCCLRRFAGASTGSPTATRSWSCCFPPARSGSST